MKLTDFGDSLTSAPPPSVGRLRCATARMLPVLALVAGFVVAAQAQSVTFSGPSSIHEGGRVAQQFGSCPSPKFDIVQFNSDNSSLTVGSMPWYMALIAAMREFRTGVDTTYCEYRDVDVSRAPDGVWRESEFVRPLHEIEAEELESGAESGERGPGPGRMATLEITIHNAAAGSYGIGIIGDRLNFSRDGDYQNLQFFGLTAGETRTLEFEIAGRANFVPNDEGTEEGVQVIPPGQGSVPIKWHIRVIDDDNVGYIGRRRAHPYGEDWPDTPYCWGEANCAYDDP